MTKDKKTMMYVQGTTISILSRKEEDYISLTDMVKHFEGGSALIEQWLREIKTPYYF